MTAIITRYQGPPFLCVADCSEPASWLLTGDLGKDGEPVDNWDGLAWCDDHVPENGSDDPPPAL